MKQPASRKIALCGILAALAIVLLLLGGFVPFAVYCCPMLAMLLLVPLMEECSVKICICWYLAVSLLALLLTPDKETAFVFVFLGWYPIARRLLGKLPKLPRIIGKLLLFNVAVFAMYAMMIFLFRMEAVAAEFQSAGLPVLIMLLVLANVLFLVFDILLGRMTVYFHKRKGRR